MPFIKFLYSLLILLVATANLDAQIKYSVNAGVKASNYDAGLSCAIEGSYPLSEKAIFNNGIQLNYSQFKSSYLWSSNEISTFHIIKFSSLRLNLLSEFDFQILSYLRVGVGINGGIRLNQKYSQFTQKVPNTLPNIPEQSNISLFTLGVTSKVRIDIKRFYVQLRYVHILNNTWTFDAYDSKGEKVVGAVKSRPIHFLVGFTF